VTVRRNQPDREREAQASAASARRTRGSLTGWAVPSNWGEEADPRLLQQPADVDDVGRGMPCRGQVHPTAPHGCTRRNGAMIPRPWASPSPQSLIAKGGRELIDSIAPEAARTTADLARRQRRRGLAWLALGGDKRPFLGRRRFVVDAQRSSARLTAVVCTPGGWDSVGRSDRLSRSSPNDMRRDARVPSARPRGRNRESRLHWSAALCVQPPKHGMRQLGAPFASRNWMNMLANHQSSR
jgi:hypothetical protein